MQGRAHDLTCSWVTRCVQSWGRRLPALVQAASPGLPGHGGSQQCLFFTLFLEGLTLTALDNHASPPSYFYDEGSPGKILMRRLPRLHHLGVHICCLFSHKWSFSWFLIGQVTFTVSWTCCREHVILERHKGTKQCQHQAHPENCSRPAFCLLTALHHSSCLQLHRGL